MKVENNKNEEVLVSIFVPYYNDCAFLRDCIDSILNQSYKNFELILLDHASTDGSSQIAKAYTDGRIKHISLQKNLGAGGGALVKEFINVAKGDYVKLFCADDMMFPDCISILVDYMKQNPLVDVVFGNVRYVDEHLHSLKNDWFNNRRGFDIDDRNIDILRKLKDGKSFLPYIGSFAKRKAFESVKLNQTFIMMFDMSLWTEMLLNGLNFTFLNKVIASYRVHKKQVSAIYNVEKVSTRSFYESVAFCDIFYSYVRNVNMLKAIYSESPFVKYLDENDLDLIEFVIAHYYLSGINEHYKVNAYLRLEKIFANDELRSRIDSKFSYGIKEFREDYSGKLVTSFKSKIYRKKPENLNIGDILFLLFRNVWDFISLKNMRRKRKYTA